MTIRARKIAVFVFAAAAGAMGLLINENISLTQPSSLITQADARVGRPLTATSVAGVARRTTRRTVRRGAAVGAAAATGAYYRSGCYRDYRGVLICP